MGSRPDSTLCKRKIVIGMLIAGMMNKQSVRHFQACDSTISSLRTRSVRWAVSKIENHADRSRKTTRREDIDNVTSFRRNRFLSKNTWFGKKCHVDLDLCQNSSKTTEGCASALTSLIRRCSLHKCVRLNWATTFCKCILDDIGIRKTSEMARHVFN